MKNLTIALLLLTVLVPGRNSATTTYENSWDRGWQSRTVSQSCHLEIAIPAYGKARFVSSALSSKATDLSFELQAARDFQGGQLEVWRVAPEWKRDPAELRSLGHLAHIRQGGSVSQGGIAQEMFLALKDGYDLVLRGKSNVRAPGSLVFQLGALEFLPAMQNFIDCAHTSVTVAWHQVSRVRVAFAVNEHQVVDPGQLDALVAYAQNDPAVATIFIDGHTDNSGGERSNYALAKRRAQAVQDYLVNAGLHDRELVVRYHGERYPVADNESVAGRAENRRATVRLERQTPTSLATK